MPRAFKPPPFQNFASELHQLKYVQRNNNMPLLIPVVNDSKGETVTPTCYKDDGPFTCLGCAKPLVLRQGEKNRGISRTIPRTMTSVLPAGKPTSTWPRNCCWSRTSLGSSSSPTVVACDPFINEGTEGARRYMSIATTVCTPRTWACSGTGSWRLPLRSWRRTRLRENRWLPGFLAWGKTMCGRWKRCAY